jgi:hypothetical protein
MGSWSRRHAIRLALAAGAVGLGGCDRPAVAPQPDVAPRGFPLPEQTAGSSGTAAGTNSTTETADPGQARAAGAVLARLQDALAAYPDADRIPALAVASKPLTQRVTGWLDTCAGHLPPAARDALRGWRSSSLFPGEYHHQGQPGAGGASRTVSRGDVARAGRGREARRGA